MSHHTYYSASWGQSQDLAFSAVEAELVNPTVLCHYNPSVEMEVSADASSYGLGAVLLQKCSNSWRPVAFVSRSLTETEQHYAQIEKEALATTWACEMFSNCILGTRIIIGSDHKPLIPLLSSNHLDSLPPRILCFRLQFNFSIMHVPGKIEN